MGVSAGAGDRRKDGNSEEQRFGKTRRGVSGERKKPEGKKNARFIRNIIYSIDLAIVNVFNACPIDQNREKIGG